MRAGVDENVGAGEHAIDGFLRLLARRVMLHWHVPTAEFAVSGIAVAMCVRQVLVVDIRLVWASSRRDVARG